MHLSRWVAEVPALIVVAAVSDATVIVIVVMDVVVPDA